MSRKRPSLVLEHLNSTPTLAQCVRLGRACPTWLDGSLHISYGVVAMAMASSAGEGEVRTGNEGGGEDHCERHGNDIVESAPFPRCPLRASCSQWRRPHLASRPRLASRRAQVVQACHAAPLRRFAARAASRAAVTCMHEGRRRVRLNELVSSQLAEAGLRTSAQQGAV